MFAEAREVLAEDVARDGRGGVFEVSVDGDLVFDKAEDAYDLGAITAAVEDRV